MKNTYGVDSVVIPNIVDLTEFKYTPKQKTDTFRFLSALGYKDIHLTIMGDGPELANIKELANSFGISDKITFTGSYIRSDFAKELAKSDCFVLPSRSETFGIVYIEALATGTPVIVTICGGPGDFVNDENGMLVDVDDVNGLASIKFDAVFSDARFENDVISKLVIQNYSFQNIVNAFFILCEFSYLLTHILNSIIRDGA